MPAAPTVNHREIRRRRQTDIFRQRWPWARPAAVARQKYPSKISVRIYVLRRAQVARGAFVDFAPERVTLLVWALGEVGGAAGGGDG